MNTPRVGFPLQGNGRPSPSASQDLVSQLDALKAAIPESQRRIASSIRTAVQMVAQHGIATTRSQMGPLLHISPRGEVDLYLHTSMLTPATLDMLRQQGVQVQQSDAPSGLVYATVALDALERIAVLPFIHWIRRPSYGVRRTGSVTSEGDTVMRANLVRANFGVTGASVRVGIISDSLTDLATAVNSGDLPATLTIVDGVDIFLQWLNPFDSSANTADYDLLLVDVNGNTLAVSNDDQLHTHAPPLEDLTFTNTTGRSIAVGVVINRVAGPALPLSLNFITSGSVTVLQHNVASSSVFGHPCVRDAIAVGAVDVHTPGFDTLEPFSSQGPCELFFPTHELRTKPDVAGADRVSTTLPVFRPFVGTSAAAPHVAAVAALLFEAAGGPAAVSNTRIANTLRVAAVDRGMVGVDNQFGFGVVDALAAVQTLRAGPTPPRSVIDAPAADLIISPNTAVTVQGRCVNAAGDQVFTVAWDFSGVAPPTTVLSPGQITFPTVGSFPITFTCTDATGHSDPSPAVRIVTVHNPPESLITSPGADVTITAGQSVPFTGTCSSPDNSGPFTFLWNFGSSASPSTSTQQNPRSVVFSTPGTFTVSFSCTDALGITDPSPAAVHVTVVAVAARQSSGGGGGCTLRPGGQAGRAPLVDALGNILLPVLVSGAHRCLALATCATLSHCGRPPLLYGRYAQLA